MRACTIIAISLFILATFSACQKEPVDPPPTSTSITSPVDPPPSVKAATIPATR